MNRYLLATALAVEARKALAARVLLGTTIMLVAGVGGLGALTILAAASGDPELVAKLGPAAAQGGWPGLLDTVDQVTAAAGLLAFGVVLSWSYGREFAEGTITGLFALPVSRPTIAVAKLLVYLLWTVVVAAMLVAVVVVAGIALGLGAPDSDAWVGLGRLASLVCMTAFLAMPAAWVATLGRGLLPGIATTVAVMAVTQIVVVAGADAGWFPFAAAALWALQPGSVHAAQLAFVAVVPGVAGVLTLLAWARLQLDR
jgi:ABC-2 type transport system permease protein